MTINEKATVYSKYLVAKKRDNGETFICMTDDRPQELHDAIYEAHDGALPSDWVFGTFADLLEKIDEYDIETIEDLEETRHEIVDNYVDIYTHDLLQWLASDVGNLEYLEDAMAERHFVKEDGAWQVLAYAQYLAIDEVMRCVVSLLENNTD